MPETTNKFALACVICAGKIPRELRGHPVCSDACAVKLEELKTTERRINAEVAAENARTSEEEAEPYPEQELDPVTEPMIPLWMEPAHLASSLAIAVSECTDPERALAILKVARNFLAEAELLAMNAKTPR